MNTESPSPSLVDDLPEQPPQAAPAGIHVEISDTQSHLKVDHAAVSQLVRAALRHEGVIRATISIALVDDATIRPINKTHLGHDWPTDVITFTLSEADEPLAGELVVSAEMAEVTARLAGVPSWDELALYTVHGLLHLCGHDDASDVDRARMRQTEAAILSLEGLTNTFPAALGLEPIEPASAAGRESVRCKI